MLKSQTSNISQTNTTMNFKFSTFNLDPPQQCESRIFGTMSIYLVNLHKYYISKVICL